jgi:hypothetical protein
MSLSGVMLLLLGIVAAAWITANAFRFLLFPKRPEYNMYSEEEREVFRSIFNIIQEFQVRNPGKNHPLLDRIKKECFTYSIKQ